MKAQTWMTLTLGGLSILCLPTRGQAATVTVPFTWTITPGGSPVAYAMADNTGPLPNSITATDTQFGFFTIGFNHTPPPWSVPLDPLPTTVDVMINAEFFGSLDNTTLGGGVTANGNLTVSAGSFPSFTPVSIGLAPAGVPFSQLRTTNYTVGVGTIGYLADVETTATYGLPNPIFLPNLNKSRGTVALAVTGKFVTPSPINIRYEQLHAVTEPITTLFGSGIALGFGGLLKREYSRKQKKLKQRQ